jgi:carboxyl-terminal processing protease
MGVSVDVAATYIKGKEGTTVTLTIRRDAEEFSADVTRRSIEVEYTTYKMLSDNIGYIRITEFETNTYKQFAQAVGALKDMGMQGLIIDLRQNPGGAVDETIDIADDLLGSVDIIYTLDKSGRKKVYTSNASKTVEVPVVCLIDENSASASEILAIALKDNAAATIVGVTSYGKGIMQTLIPLSDGSMYKYTFCEYYGPAGTKIHELGVIPDVEVQQNADYKNVAVESIPEGSDAQLSKAIEVIKNKISE